MSNHTLSELMQLQHEFDAAHGKDETWAVNISQDNLGELEHGVVCLAGEVGEFANKVKKVARGDLLLDQALPGLREELTDVFIYLMKICNQLGIDLGDSYLEKLAANRKRFQHLETK
jgi:NTP pyrophosphatase (non-canonical NTP hydrolase)